MTYAPARLLELRHYLQPITGLGIAELGIVGDQAHLGGYHHGWDDRRVSGDYSWSESARDSSHKTNAARAFDLGMFPLLRQFSIWLAAECAKGAPDTLDIREVIYSPDGQTVKRWDRLGKRSTGDLSHLGHTHVSFFADAEDRDKTAVFKRFFGDDMEQSDTLTSKTNFANRSVGNTLADLANLRDAMIGSGVAYPPEPANWPKPGSPLHNLAHLPEILAATPQPVHLSDGDRIAIAAMVAAELKPSFDALAAELRDAVADLGEGGAAQVRADS